MQPLTFSQRADVVEALKELAEEPDMRRGKPSLRSLDEFLTSLGGRRLKIVANVPAPVPAPAPKPQGVPSSPTIGAMFAELRSISDSHRETPYGQEANDLTSLHRALNTFIAKYDPESKGPLPELVVQPRPAPTAPSPTVPVALTHAEQVIVRTSQHAADNMRHKPGYCFKSSAVQNLLTVIYRLTGKTNL